MMKKTIFKMTLEAKKLPQYTEIKNLESISKKDGSGIGLSLIHI